MPTGLKKAADIGLHLDFQFPVVDDGRGERELGHNLYKLLSTHTTSQGWQIASWMVQLF